MFNLKSIKTQLIIFLSAFAFYLAIKAREPIFLLSIMVTVSAAVIAESSIIFLKKRTLSFTDSSIITGLIIGFVLSSKQTLWIQVAASFLAILSKHVIRIYKRHIFNPAAFGIFFSTVLLGATTQWKGIYYWYILLPFGLYFISKIHKIELLVVYAVTALSIFGIQALIQETNILNIFWYLNYFFIFIMLIEPKTTPVASIGKVIFGSLVAVIVFIFTQIGIRFDAELSALLLGNLTAPLLNRIRY